MSTTLNLSQLNSGRRISQASIVWTILTAAISVTLGIQNNSLVLGAFGLTGLFDAAGSAAIVFQLSHGLKHNELDDKHERIAFRVVVTGLTVVAIATLAASIYRLLGDSTAEGSTIGIVVAAASFVVLFVLARAKRRIGKAIPSAALQADGVLSFVGCALALVTVIGSFFVHAGIEWVDPAAAIAIAVIAIGSAVVLNRAEG